MSLRPIRLVLSALFLMLAVEAPAQAQQTPAAAECLRAGGMVTSADYLLTAATCLYGQGNDAESLTRLALLEDIHIKARSYKYLNSFAFWTSLGLSLTVLFWPVLAPVWQEARKAAEEAQPPKGWKTLILRLGASSGTQTILTALAAFSIGLYVHYKSSQVQAETLMRQVYHAETLDAAFVAGITADLARIDSGFRFAPTE